MLARTAPPRPQSVISHQSPAEELQQENFAIVQSSATVPSLTLYRLAAVAGMGSALILLVNAAKRSSLIATTDLTQLLAPVAEILALGLVVGLFLAFGRRAGLFGTIAFVINFVALASLVGVEAVINLVFSKLPLTTIVELRAGPLGLALVASSVLFLVGTLAFVISLAVARGVPRIPLALYLIGAVPIALRAFVPELALDLGLAMLAASIAWLAAWLWMRGATSR
ncbi:MULTISPECIES: hypothetical protein [unclassified Mesorhizobium]|uniref:hypothetical protein n=1 Tax=unclassified Mesorhizobium TaxID=325217 RepID=UPI001AED2B9D|nr:MULTISPECIES: hypothetical protein [unclassified Mesorhizobium]MBZ9920329.1 hypothetical protein [Mesorhizobium sp. BR1-1-7]MBZ9952742.1 hypothetical protein [Mesorhizobium sp. BR1-1-15]MBZ9960498.1 hypothetical protein [Mesorhizobium sp. BR1-1-14]MBZ9968566.1 hypothetical protein [Mesorhizobium sp. BR1-1-12]UCI14029.1 hypothetical protein FJ972_03895 [Mesorhizobium sp. B2-1-1]